MIAAAITKNAKESWKVIIIGILFLIIMAQGFPVITEWFYPILDTKGGNLSNMEIRERIYHPGDMVFARFKFQKQRNVVGRIKWELIRISPDPRTITLYEAREVSAPVSIIDHFARVERLSEDEMSGRYRFRGTISYPGGIVYNLATECFEVVGSKK